MEVSAKKVTRMKPKYDTAHGKRQRTRKNGRIKDRMKMRNIGRDTVTSSGPNSFGKTKQGFVDSAKLFERQLQMQMEEVSNDKS